MTSDQQQSHEDQAKSTQTLHVEYTLTTLFHKLKIEPTSEQSIISKMQPLHFVFVEYFVSDTAISAVTIHRNLPPVLIFKPLK